MKFLIVVKQKKNVETFLATIEALIGRGHTVSLAVQERHDQRVGELTGDLVSPDFALVPAPVARTDAWADAAPLLRSLADCLHYQQPRLHGAQKLQARTIDKLREELRLRVDDREAAALLRQIPPPQIDRLASLLGLAEERLPTDPLYDAFLGHQRPDVLLLSPLVHFGSAQADLVASARRLGIPVGMLLFSWDNLSTKGRLHVAPDWMFVWNERQRAEAAELHRFPADRVVVAGAPRFDAFFALRPQLTATDFLGPLGLDPSAPTFLYVCSSPFVSSGELAFVRQWLRAVRASAGAARRANVIVRPHPDVDLLDADVAVEQFRWPAARGLQGLVSRPFGDPHAVVLRTSDRARQGLFECIVHSAAVVGLNTSAELEAAIVGRPVYTVLAGDAHADGQAGTLHFHYLLEGRGGFVRGANGLDEHIAQLDAEVAAPSDGAAIRRFVGEFLRPLGVDRPVASQLAEAIERTFAAAPAAAPARAVTHQPAPGDSDADADVDGLAAPVRERPTVEVPFAKEGAMRLVRPEGGETPRLDRRVTRWILEQVAVGEVFYDLAAGEGLYAVLAAKQRGATVVAVEPGYAAFRDLCDNLVLNGCDGTVAPLAVALADFEGLGRLKFPLGHAGRGRHAISREAWKPRRAAGAEKALIQPVCATTLDLAVGRYNLPAPNHVRVANLSTVREVLGGAAATLTAPSLRSVFITMRDEDRDWVCRLLDGCGLTEAWSAPLKRERQHVVFARRA